VAYNLRIEEPGDEPRIVTIDTVAEIGRHGDHVRLVDPTVSRRHVRLEVRADGVAVSDLDSTYGTYVRGHKVTTPVLLQDGERVIAGETTITLLGPAGADRPSFGGPAAAPAGAATFPSASADTSALHPTGQFAAPTATPAPPPAAAPGPPAGSPPVTAPPPLGATPAPPGSAPGIDPTMAAPTPYNSSAAFVPAQTAATAPPPVMPQAPPSLGRPTSDGLASIDADGAAIVKFRPGSAGEKAAKAVAVRVKKARRRLEGFGSEGWGTIPTICLVDPFPDPATGELVLDGTIVDAERNEIWMVVTPESPPEPPERALTLLFGAALPAAGELEVLLEGYGLWLAKTPRPDDQLSGVAIVPPAMAQGELRSILSLSLIYFLLDREKEDVLRRTLSSTQPGRLDHAFQEHYGLPVAALMQAWMEKVGGDGPTVKTGQFMKLAWRYLRPYKKKQAEVFFYMLFSLAFATVFPFVTKALFDTVLPEAIATQQFGGIASLLGGLGIAFIVSLLAGLRQAYQSAWISGAVVRDLRSQMFGKLQTLSTGWFRRHQQGDVLTRLFNDVMVLEQGLTTTLREGIFQSLSLVVSSIVMLTLNPLLGIIVLIGAPLVAVVYKSMATGAQSRGLAVQQDTGALMNIAAENYDAEPVVKLFSLQGREVGRFQQLSERLFRSERRLNLYGGLFGLSVNTIVTLLRLVILGLGAYLIVQGSFTVGGLIAFLGVMGEVLAPVTTLTSVGQQVQQSSGALYRIEEILNEQPELVEPPDAQTLPRLSQEIRIQGVDFSYNAERQILTNVDAVIPAGQRVAFVGASGSGKSTIFQLLMRLYDPDEGSVLYDGFDARAVTVDSLRGQLGVVFQDNFLFDTTLRENIAMGKPGCTDEEVVAAAQAAEVHTFIDQLPRGYDTTVGERGGMLSGGQRQRVAIARALVRNPQILLLDEATSALDPKTERAIIGTLNRVGQGRTTVAITHRLTSISGYDTIFVVHEGRIAEQGDHHQLIAAGGLYARLWAEQTGQAIPQAQPSFDALDAISRVPIFHALTPDRLAPIVQRLVAQELAAGATMPDSEGALVLLARGRGRVLTPDGPAGWSINAELGPGDTFGVSALLNGATGSCLQAVEPTTVLVLATDIIAGIVASEPSVAASFDGNRVSAAGPQGGTRLTRVTTALSRDELAAALAAGAGGAGGTPDPGGGVVPATTGGIYVPPSQPVLPVTPMSSSRATLGMAPPPSSPDNEHF